MLSENLRDAQHETKCNKFYNFRAPFWLLLLLSAQPSSGFRFRWPPAVGIAITVAWTNLNIRQAHAHPHPHRERGERCPALA